MFLVFRVGSENFLGWVLRPWIKSYLGWCDGSKLWKVFTKNIICDWVIQIFDVKIDSLIALDSFLLQLFEFVFQFCLALGFFLSTATVELSVPKFFAVELVDTLFGIFVTFKWYKTKFLWSTTFILYIGSGLDWKPKLEIIKKIKKLPEMERVDPNSPAISLIFSSSHSCGMFFMKTFVNCLARSPYSLIRSFLDLNRPTKTFFSFRSLPFTFSTALLAASSVSKWTNP